jgi:hypothetical protein
MQQVLARAGVTLALVLAAVVGQAPGQTPGDAPESRPVLNLDPDDPLGDLATRMQVITKRLSDGETGDTVQPKELDAVQQLDALIAVLKKKSGS